MSKYENLFWQILTCDGEEALYKLVANNELLQNSNNWYPYGGKNKEDRSNFGTFENQQQHSGAALVEKITNSIDALLLKQCKRNGIDSKSLEAPKTMESATEKFFKIPKGDIGELLPKDRTQMARDNIQIIATGDDKNSDLTIWDNGEGQHPDDFKDTFLSIANNNKTDISFVQGKYNMGSTGAVVFCGKYRYQLIASKKDHQVFNKEQKHTNNLFGWTLVRRHPLTREEGLKYGSSWYEYFAISGEKIPQFEIDELDIGLFQDKKFIAGSFIKLYTYEMPKGAKTAITDGLYQEFNQLLYKPALPFWLLEKRKKYLDRKLKDIAVYGNHVRINSPDGEEGILECQPIHEELRSRQIGHVKVQAIVFKIGEDKKQQAKRKTRYIGTGRNVVYTLNGQVQGTEGQSFITQNLKYNFLKDSMLVVIDCSSIKTEFRQDLFMANRSNLRECEKSRLLRNKVIELLRRNDKLKQLNIQRRDAVLQGGDDKKEKELIENLLSKVPLDKSLTNLLKKGSDLINLPAKKEQTAPRGKKEKRPRATKRFPSIFKINVKKDKATGKKIKSIPLNGKGIIQFETDVAEDYFYRPQEKGELQIHIMEGKGRNDSDNPDPRPSPISNKIEDSFEVNQTGPHDGSIKLTLKPQKELNVGDEIKLNAQLTSPDGDMESTFYVKIVDPQKLNTAKKEDTEPEKPQLPKIIKINKAEDGRWLQDNNAEWKQVEDWDEYHIVHIIPSDEEEQPVVSAIAINMDSYSLRKYIFKNDAKSESGIEYLRNLYLSKIYLHGLFLYSILEKLRIQKEEEDSYSRHNTQSSEDLLAQIFINYSDVLLHLDTNKEILDSLNE